MRHALPEDEYIAALLKDIEFSLPGIWGRRVTSIFIGGGTPSLLSGRTITNLMQGVRARLNLLPDCEVTLEANPGASDAERFAACREAGINRLSIGIQSFDNKSLHALGRIHNADDAHQAIEAACAAGFDNINLDLMFGLPAQGRQQAIADLDTAIQYRTSHLSLYQLTIEDNTEFAVRPPVLPDADCLWDMQCELQRIMQQQNYINYEVSAWAQPGRQCRHNLNYWTFGDYLGIGAGAHSKLSTHDKILRFAKSRHPRDYLNKAGTEDCVSGQYEPAGQDLVFEFMLNALRLEEGFDAGLFESHTRLPFSDALPVIEQAINKGWLDYTDNMIRPSAEGRKFLNDVISLFLP